MVRLSHAVGKWLISRRSELQNFFFKSLLLRRKVSARRPRVKIDAESGNLVLATSVDSNSDIRISFRGMENEITLGKNCKIDASIYVYGNKSRISIGDNVNLKGKIVLKGSRKSISIGNNSTFQSIYLLADEACNVHIGKWCMFSRDVELRTSDAHSVVDIDTGFRVNGPEDVFIGDHVWVGAGAFLSKGCNISSDSIIGAHSFVNAVFHESQVIIAGSPARIVKRRVTWSRDRKSSFDKSELDFWTATN